MEPSNDQMPDAEGQTSKSIEQPSNSSEEPLIDIEELVANGPLLSSHPSRYYGHAPAKSTPPVRGNDYASTSNNETPSSEGVRDEVRCPIAKIQLLERQILTPDNRLREMVGLQFE